MVWQTTQLHLTTSCNALTLQKLIAHQDIGGFFEKIPSQGPILTAYQQVRVFACQGHVFIPITVF